MQIKGVPNLNAYQVGSANDSKESRDEAKKDRPKKQKKEEKSGPSSYPGNSDTRIISPSSDLIPDSQIIDSQSVVDLMQHKPPSKKSPKTFEKKKVSQPPSKENRRKIDRSC